MGDGRDPLEPRVSVLTSIMRLGGAARGSAGPSREEDPPEPVAGEPAQPVEGGEEAHDPSHKAWPALRMSSLSTRRLSPSLVHDEEQGAQAPHWWLPGRSSARGPATAAPGPPPTRTMLVPRPELPLGHALGFTTTEAARSGEHWPSVASFGARQGRLVEPGDANPIRRPAASPRASPFSSSTPLQASAEAIAVGSVGNEISSVAAVQRSGTGAAPAGGGGGATGSSPRQAARRAAPFASREGSSLVGVPGHHFSSSRSGWLTRSPPIPVALASAGTGSPRASSNLAGMAGSPPAASQPSSRLSFGPSILMGPVEGGSGGSAGEADEVEDASYEAAWPLDDLEARGADASPPTARVGAASEGPEGGRDAASAFREGPERGRGSLGQAGVAEDEAAARSAAAGAPSSAANLTTTLVTGLVNSLLSLPVMVSFTAIIFRDPFFTPYLGSLVKVVFLCSAMHQTVFCLLSTMPFAVGQVQDVGLIFLSAMASSVSHRCVERAGASPEDALATTLLTLTLSTLLVGVAIVIVALLRLARLVQYIPVPVIGGYLAFVGYFCLCAGVSLASGTEIGDLQSWKALADRQALLHLAPAVAACSAIFWVQRHVSSPFALPALLITIPATFFVALRAGGWTLDDARDAGWVLPQQPGSGGWQFWHAWDLYTDPDGAALGGAGEAAPGSGAATAAAAAAAAAGGGGWWGLFTGAATGADGPLGGTPGRLVAALASSPPAPAPASFWHRICWSAIPGEAGKLGALFFVVAFGSSLDVAAIQSDAPAPLDYNAELVTVGLSNVAAGLTGFGFTGSYIFSQTLFSLRMGVDSRVAGAMLVCAELAAFALPIDPVAYLPKLLFGALVMWIGQDILKDWVFVAATRVSRGEYALLLGTFSAIMALGLEVGVFLGVLGCAASFAVAYARVTLTPFHVVASRSGAVRAYRDRAALELLSDRICACALTGYLFFGSALTACDAVAELAAAMVRGNAIDIEAIRQDAAKEGAPAAARLAALFEGDSQLRSTGASVTPSEVPEGGRGAAAGRPTSGTGSRRERPSSATSAKTVSLEEPFLDASEGEWDGTERQGDSEGGEREREDSTTGAGAAALPPSLAVEPLRAARAAAPLFLILDWRRVKGLDATAARSFVNLHSRLSRMGVRLLLAHLPMDRPAIRRVLLSQGLLLKEAPRHGDGLAALDVSLQGGCPWFKTLDGALQACEEALLEVARRAGLAQPRAAAMTLEQVLLAHDDGGTGEGAHVLPVPAVPGAGARSQRASQTALAPAYSAAETARRLARYARPVEVAPGEVLFEKGAAPDEFFIIRSGRVSVRIGYSGDAVEAATPVSQERDFHYDPGGIVGELDFFLARPRGFSARAASPGELWSFSRRAIDALARESPETFLVLQSIVLRSACLTVAHTVEALDRSFEMG